MQPKIKEVADKWAIPMSSAIPLKKIEVHQPFNVAGIVGNDKSILISKYPGLKIWKTQVGYILERNGNRCLVENTNVIVGIIDE